MRKPRFWLSLWVWVVTACSGAPLAEPETPVAVTTDSELSASAPTTGSPCAQPNATELIPEFGSQAVHMAALASAGLVAASMEDGIVIDRAATCGDLAAIDSLEVRDTLTLDGIEHLVGLSSLRLHAVRSGDLEPLTALGSLRVLEIGPPVWEVGQVDMEPLAIAPLAELPGLESLVLRGGRLVDISPLSALTQLQTLNLDYNDIVDLTPLAGASNLRDLSLDFNEVVSLAPLRSLARLERLVVSNNPIPDLAPLSALATLKELVITNTEVGSLAPLLPLTALEMVWPCGTPVDLDPVARVASAGAVHQMSERGVRIPLGTACSK